VTVADRTVERAHSFLRRNQATIDTIGGPFPPAALALMIIRESGGKVDALTSQGGRKGFWECGLTLRTVYKRNGHGTAYEQDVDPLDFVSAIFGAQADYFDTITTWRDWLSACVFDVPGHDEIHAWLALMHAPYSVGWQEAKALLVAGRRPGFGAIHGECGDPLSCFRACLDLDDAHLPDIGPQTDAKIRERLHRLLDFPDDARRVGNLPWKIPSDPPRRIPLVRRFPRFLGPRGLQARLRGLAKARNLPA